MSHALLPDRTRWCEVHQRFYITWGRQASCFTCRSEKSRARYQQQMAVRRPPRPAFEKLAGLCNLCGEKVTGRRRSWCSDDCVRLWFVATNPSSALSLLVDDFGWVCWSCWQPADQLEVDHRRPLWSLTEDQRTELRWWLPFNLQLLCEACHRTKTRAEAGDRASLRRAARLASAVRSPQPEQLGLLRAAA